MHDDDLVIPDSIPEGPMRSFLEGLRERVLRNEAAGNPSPPPPPKSVQYIARRDCKIPEGFDPALDSPLLTTALVQTRAFMEDRKWTRVPNFLVLAGLGGTGKTTAAAWACDRPGGYFVKATDLGQHHFDAKYWDRIEEASVLVVDDLGAEPLDDKGWALSAFHKMVDLRYDRMRATILTTQLAPARFFERYGTGAGERSKRRLTERGKIITVTTYLPEVQRVVGGAT